MRGPIDYIIVSFEGNKFNGRILRELGAAIDSGVIGLISLGLVAKDAQGEVVALGVQGIGDEYVAEFVRKYKPDPKQITVDDIDEVGELLDNNTSAGMLVVEHLWAKPLKRAIIEAGGELVAEGRIHPDAADEID